jgi:hypothetical protein
MGNAGSQSGELNTALSTGSYVLATRIAKELPRVDLSDAVRLTILAAAKDPERFDALAQRCLVRLIEERQVTLNDVLWVAQRFQDLREGTGGETGLMNLLRQQRHR